MRMERSGFFREFLRFLREEKVLWITPIIVFLLLLLALLLLTESSSSVKPFVYTVG